MTRLYGVIIHEARNRDPSGEEWVYDCIFRYALEWIFVLMNTRIFHTRLYGIIHETRNRDPSG